jgi:hypothetical protein
MAQKIVVNNKDQKVLIEAKMEVSIKKKKHVKLNNFKVFRI